MARYGGNTPCIEVVSANEGHRIILDLGSGAFDLGQKILGEMFQRKKKVEEEEHVANNGTSEDGENGNGEKSVVRPSKPLPKLGGTILLTHTHWDHIQGVFLAVSGYVAVAIAIDFINMPQPISFYLRFSSGLPFFVPLYLPQFDWTIFGPRGVAKSLQEILSGQMQHEYFPVRLGDMPSHMKYVGLSEDEDEGIWLDGENCGDGESTNGEESKILFSGTSTSIKVTTKYLNHTVLTLGYKLEEFVTEQSTSSSDQKLRKKRGVSVAYITDHEPYDHELAKGGYVPPSPNSTDTSSTHLTADQSHAEFFRDVDIVFHDCQYYFSEYGPQSTQSKENWGHSTVEYVIEVAFFSNVKHLVLFHHDPQRKDDDMDTLLGYARSRAAELEKEYPGHGSRVSMKVDAAIEGGIYELDPFIYADDDDNEIVADGANRLNGLHYESSSQQGATESQSVLLSFFRTNSDTMTDMLKSSNSHLTVKSLQSVDDIVRYSRKHHPSVIVLDQQLFGCSGLDICEKIRTDMGDWGKEVPLLMIAPPRTNGESSNTENDDQQISKFLNGEDYIQGPYSPAYLLTRIHMCLLRIPLRWRRAPLPSNEPTRLATLQNTGLLDSEPEERFDRITRLAKAMFNVPIALVSLVDEDRQWFKSSCGLSGVAETPRDHAFCAHAILNDDLFVVPDALQDERFADNPLVVGAPNVRFYAGYPLKTPMLNGDGSQVTLGSLCVIDSKPRDLRLEER